MFELTNEQRKCFALPAVLDTWQKIEIAPYTYVYLDGHRVAKVIRTREDLGHELYCEYAVEQMLSDDRTMLLPKTAKGKPQKFTWANLEKRTPVGMALSYSESYLSIVNHDSDQAYYCSAYDEVTLDDFQKFRAWVDAWCKDTDASSIQRRRLLSLSDHPLFVRIRADSDRL